MRIELLIACEDSAFGESIARALAATGDLLPIASRVAPLAGLAQAARAAPFDIALVEDDGEGCAASLGAIARTNPRARSLVLYETCTHVQLLDAIRHGACGCVLKANDAALIAKAVRTVYCGDKWFGRSVLFDALRGQIGSPVVDTTGKLTQRESEILDFIGRGLTNKEIARRLTISELTVKTHLHRIYVKLHQSGRYKAFLQAPRNGTGS